MKLELIPYTLELKEPFVISRDAYSEKKSLIVKLSDKGYSGYGEACEHVFYGNTLDGMLETLTFHKEAIEQYDFKTPEQFWEDFAEQLSAHPFAQCALDQAAHDLYGKIMTKPCYELWDLNIDHLPISNYTIGIGSIEEMIDKMKRQPFPLYKIKLGTENDIEIIEALRAHTDAVFRIDANCAWTAKQTIDYSEKLKRLGVEFIEQPLPADQMEAMKEVYQYAFLPIIADESCKNLADVSQCFERFHGINIKLMKCGGITPARKMINAARQYGMKVMVGCMTEGSIGISAIAHLLPMLDYVDMDAAMLLANNPSTGVYLNEEGQAVFPDGNGLGCELKI